jgi:hypothetical protein
MSYAYSSAYSRLPNSTPQTPISIRPPIHNPYDKFTQPQFDEWIGGITSTLRKALGQAEEETPASQLTEPREEDAYPALDTDYDNVEDSFAEWKAMRAKEKGKMRATEDEQHSEYGSSQESCEGSGIRGYTGGDTQDDAIEVLSDDDNDNVEEEEYDGEDHNGGLIEGFSPTESDGKMEHPYDGDSEPAMSSKTCHDFSITTGQQSS